MSDLEQETQEPADGVSAAEGSAPRGGLYLTPRQTYLMIAAVLGVALIGLVAYVLWASAPADFTKQGGSTQSGIEPVVQMYGPGRGVAPQFDKPMAATWGKQNRVYVADTQNHRIVVFNEAGSYLLEFGGFGIAKPLKGVQATWKPGLLDYPTDVATDANGNVYVADFYNDSISVFDTDGRFLRRFPDPNQPVGKGSSGYGGGGIAVTALAVHGDEVYATDMYQVVVFNTEGKFLRQFGRPGLEPGNLDHPNGIAVDSRGRIYVSDSNHNRVTAYTPEGKVIWSTGEKISELMAETKNPFVLPRGLTVLRDGSILVADPLGQKLVKLDENGKVVAEYGVRGDQPGQLNFPNDVSSRGDLILVSDRENNRVQVVKLTGK